MEEEQYSVFEADPIGSAQGSTVSAYVTIKHSFTLARRALSVVRAACPCPGWQVFLFGLSRSSILGPFQFGDLSSVGGIFPYKQRSLGFPSPLLGPIRE